MTFELMVEVQNSLDLLDSLEVKGIKINEERERKSVACTRRENQIREM